MRGHVATWDAPLCGALPSASPPTERDTLQSGKVTAPGSHPIGTAGGDPTMANSYALDLLTLGRGPTRAQTAARISLPSLASISPSPSHLGRRHPDSSSLPLGCRSTHLRGATRVGASSSGGAARGRWPAASSSGGAARGRWPAASSSGGAARGTSGSGRRGELRQRSEGRGGEQGTAGSG